VHAIDAAPNADAVNAVAKLVAERTKERMSASDFATMQTAVQSLVEERLKSLAAAAGDSPR
jgi:hypothetical protein